MSSGKFARTMQAAFGPYTNNVLYPMQEPYHPQDTIVLWGCAVAAVVALAVLVLL